MIAEITDDHYRKSPLVQGGLEIPCKVIVRLPRTFSNDKLIDKYMQLVNEVYAEPLEPFIVGRVTENENDDNFNILVTEKKVKRFEKLPTAKLKNKDEKQKGRDIRSFFTATRECTSSRSNNNNTTQSEEVIEIES